MTIQQKIGNINSTSTGNRNIDWLAFEWYETNKRILRKKTKSGTDVSLKFLNENPALTEGDILYEDAQTIIAVTVLSCDCIVIKPKNMFEMASVCYEIGNKHLPLFYENDELLVPFELPLFRLLSAQGYKVRQEERKLLQPLKTTVSPHEHSGNSLFSKIMKLTTTNE
jgi:urease accessory protein